MDRWVLERLHHLLVPHNRAPTDPTRNSTFDCSNHPGPGIIDASVEIAKVVEEALCNRFKDGEGARVLGHASAGQWLYLARTAASEINMGIASVRFLLFLLIAGA